MKNKYEVQYKKILKACLEKGELQKTRTKYKAYAIYNKHLKININKYFPILTSKHISQKIFETEFEWFINGETNIKRFKDNNISIWNEWANENGDLGPVYGHQLINYNSKGINQLKNTIEAIKTNPESRRHIISLWNPQQLKDMALPPCYLYFQLYISKGKLNMTIIQRSADLFLGVPYDIALYSLLLLYIARQTNYKVGYIYINFVNAHIYENQIKAVKQYLKNNILNPIKYFYNNKLTLYNYKSVEKIKCKVAV